MLASTSPSARRPFRLLSGVAPGNPVVVSAVDTTLSTVTMTDSAGTAVTGSLNAARTRWTSTAELDFDTRYTVTAKSASGTAVSRFTTATPAATAYPSVIPLDGETTGVGIPIIIKFSEPVADRSAVLRNLRVTSNKPAEGAWRWFGDDEVHYRTKQYWPAYTTVTLDIGIGGIHLGNGVYGETDRRISFETGASIITRISDSDKMLRAYKDGELAQTAPVSLGKPSAPSVSGNLLVMTVQTDYVLDSSTYGVPVDSPDGYRIEVDYALRLTNSGQFLHSAPWSLDQQGKVNVSHGCINTNTDTARWYYENAHRGDPVIITDTGTQVEPGDGWTHWRYSWQEWTSDN